MKRWRKQILGITLAVALATITAAPAALAALDFTSALKLFGITYVVDLFQTQINDFINTLTARQNVSAKESTKVVPIISVGTGAHVGAAQVTGPAAMVAKVQAVGQLEGDFFGGMRAKVLVPLDGRNPLQGMRRVDQVGISAIIDINIEAASSPSPAPPSLVPDSKPNPPQLVPGQPSQPQPLPVCPSVSVGLTGGAGNSREIQDTLRKWPALEYALFATDDITLRGSNIRVLGAGRANDEISARGNNISVSGDLLARKRVDGYNQGHGYPGCVVNELSLPSLNWAEMQRRASRSYRGKQTLNGNNVLRGVTSVDGDLVLDGWVQGGGLVVVHGNVTITRRGAGAPDGLLIWADGEVRLPESNTDAHVFIIAARGITVSGSNIRLVGGLAGRDIDITGNNIDILSNSTALQHFPR